jgi:glycosyltransferase involved in cell wall biosynthesis
MLVGKTAWSVNNPLDTAPPGATRRNGMPLRVHSYSYYESYGGAARATLRLHRALLRAGITAEMVVGIQSSDDATVHGPRSRIGKGLALARPSLGDLVLAAYRRRDTTAFSIGVFPGRWHLGEPGSVPDLIHLHWIASDFLPFWKLRRFKVPLIWTLHDMWPFTGGCHYAGQCEAYRDSCGSCPQLGSRRTYDLSRLLVRSKRHAFGKLPLVVVCPTSWLADRARESFVFRGADIRVIPNGVDVEVFRPLEQSLARDLLRLSPTAKYVLMAAIKGLEDPRKGGPFLLEAMRSIRNKYPEQDIRLLVLGSKFSNQAAHAGIDIHFAGHVHDDAAVALYYGAADVVAIPSTSEVLPNVAVESMACGRPCVTFAIGGMTEVVTSGETGFVVPAFSSDAFALALTDCILNPSTWLDMSKKARGKALRDYDICETTRQYLDVYDLAMRRFGKAPRSTQA